MLWALSFGVFFSSCSEDFLDKPAYGSLSDEVLADEKGVNSLLIGAYAALDLQVGDGNAWEKNPTNWIYGDITGGDAHKGSDGGDQAPINAIAAHNIDPSNGYININGKPYMREWPEQMQYCDYWNQNK